MKQKTHKGASKRIKKTGKKGSKKAKYLKGKVRNSHLKRKDRASTKHAKNRLSEIKHTHKKKIKRLLNK